MDRHVCASCYSSIGHAYKQHIACNIVVGDEWSATNSQPESPAVKQKQPKRPPKKKTNVRDSVAKSVALSILHSNYHSAFRKLIAIGPTARKAFLDVIKSEAKSEVRKYMSNCTQFPVLNGPKSVADFAWPTLVSQLTTKLPTLAAALTGAMPTKLKMNNSKSRYITSAELF